MSNDDFLSLVDDLVEAGAAKAAAKSTREQEETKRLHDNSLAIDKHIKEVIYPVFESAVQRSPTLKLDHEMAAPGAGGKVFINLGTPYRAAAITLFRIGDKERTSLKYVGETSRPCITRAMQVDGSEANDLGSYEIADVTTELVQQDILRFVRQLVEG
jgi:hypothetical protein